jgi:hypothetical protein
MHSWGAAWICGFFALERNVVRHQPASGELIFR